MLSGTEQQAAEDGNPCEKEAPQESLGALRLLTWDSDLTTRRKGEPQNMQERECKR